MRKVLRKISTGDVDFYVTDFTLVFKKVIEKDGKYYLELPRYVVEELGLKMVIDIALVTRVVDAKIKGLEE